MNTMQLIPVTPSQINGQMTQMVDGRLLHDFLQVGRDFSTWIRERIAEFEFVDGEDFIIVAAPPIRGAGNRGKRTDYFLTLDMAKELAMVERTPRGRQARRYFIECERQLQRLQQAGTATVKAHAVPLTRAERQAINRQAWADVAGLAARSFHARREELLRQHHEQRNDDIVYLPQGFRPKWAN
ncbi:MAG: antA/AntB antirepressor family protein [Rhodocyclaceae bacterium]|nr:antA/AntB antirepressor family protein [Rhodocyclaceae bacterium]